MSTEAKVVTYLLMASSCAAAWLVPLLLNPSLPRPARSAITMTATVATPLAITLVGYAFAIIRDHCTTNPDDEPQNSAIR